MYLCLCVCNDIKHIEFNCIRPLYDYIFTFVECSKLKHFGHFSYSKNQTKKTNASAYQMNDRKDKVPQSKYEMSMIFHSEPFRSF